MTLSVNNVVQTNSIKKKNYFQYRGPTQRSYNSFVNTKISKKISEAKICCKNYPKYKYLKLQNLLNLLIQYS